MPYKESLLTLTSSSNPLEARIKAPGFQTLKRSLSPGDQVITLQRGLEIEVQPNPITEVPFGAVVTLVLVGIDHEEEVELTPLPDGRHSGTVSLPGKYDCARAHLAQGLPTCRSSALQ